MPRVRYYISGHGLGHASRSGAIINALRRRHPAVAVEVVSDAAAWFFRATLPPDVPVDRRPVDVGVCQHDSLAMDLPATLRAARQWQAGREERLRTEVASLARGGVALVVTDVPAWPLAAARRAGIPGVVVSNFTWDWIYRGLAAGAPGLIPLAEELTADYARAACFLRLPFHGPPPPGVPCIDLPLVARQSARDRADIRRDLDLPADARVALISFGGFGLGEFASAPLTRLADWVFLTEAGLGRPAANVRLLSRGEAPYQDLVKAADVVVTKPGYGIVAEAIANETAVLYTSRGPFPEQELLVAALHRYTRARGISNEELRRGRWAGALTALLEQPPPEETLAADGAAAAADRLAGLLRGGKPGGTTS